MKHAIFIIKIACLLIPALSLGQTVVTGRVIDSETKKPINEVTVTRQGTNIKAVTNILGYFQLVVDSSSTIIFEHKEYQTGQVNGSIKNNFQVQLHKDWAPGGLANFYKSISKRITYPSKARSKGTQGRVYVSFEVDSISGIQNVQIVKDIGDNCGKEVVRVIENISNKWTPKTKSYTFILPVTFRLESVYELQTLHPGPVGTDVDLPKGKVLNEVVITGYMPPDR